MPTWANTKGQAQRQQAIKLNAASARPLTLSKPHYNLGLAYAALDQIPEAVGEFKHAVEIKD